MTNGASAMTSARPGRLIPVDKARNWLASVWFTLAGMIVLIVAAQSIGGAYGEAPERAFGWAFPTFMPTLGLMIAVWRTNAQSEAARTGATVPRFFFALTMSVSLFYLLLVLGLLIAQPVIVDWMPLPEQIPRENGGTEPDSVALKFALLSLSDLWLGPVQGVVAALLGALFLQKKAVTEEDG